MRALKLLFIFLILIASCGSNEDESVNIEDLRALCDGRDELVLMVKATRGRDPGEVAFWTENGNQFIHVNGKCQFWVWGDIPPFSGLWGTGSRIKTGTLTDDQGLALLEMLMFKRWKDFDRTWFAGGFHHGSRLEYFSKNAKFAFSGQDDSKEGKLRGQLSDGYQDAFGSLLDTGLPVAQNKLRLVLAKGGGIRNTVNLPTYFVNWDYHLSVEEFFAKQSPYCYGDSILLEGDDALHFAMEREKWLEASKEQHGLLIALKGKTGVIDGLVGPSDAYYFLLRDVLPHEDENGLVSFDEVPPAIECF